MSIDLTFQDTFIDKFGGLYWAYKRQNGTDVWHTGVGRIKTSAQFGQESTPIVWEDGSQGPSIDDVVKTSFVITTPDASLELEQFLKDEVVGTLFSIIMEAGKTYSAGSVKMKYRLIADAKINRDFKQESPGNEIAITITPQYNDSIVTFTGLTAIDANQSGGWVPVSLTANSITSVAAGKYYSLSAFTRPV